MGFQLSPGIVTNEIDLTTIVPSVSTTAGALAGVFPWGPLDVAVLVDSESFLAERYLKPSNFNAETWFTGANFLGYGNQLYISRAGDYTGNTVSMTFTGNTTNLAIEANTAELQLTNTAGLAVGMILFSSNDASLPDARASSIAPTITAVTNSTSVTLSENALANLESLELVFREDIVYTSVAQETEDVTIDWDAQIVKNDDEYTNVDGTFDDTVLYAARYPGKPGDSLRISVCDTPGQFSANLVLAANTTTQNAAASKLVATVGSNTLVVTVASANTSNTTHTASSNAIAGNIVDSLALNDIIQVGNSRVGYQYLKVTGIGGLSNNSGNYSLTINVDDEYKLGANVSMSSVQRYWEFYNLVEKAPGTSSYVTQFGNSAAHDELHVVVVDELGAFSGSPGTILEVHKSMSRATDAKTADKAGNYYKDVINKNSRFIWWANDRSVAPSATAQFITSSTGTHPLVMQMYGGSNGPDESNVSLGTLTFAYDKFASKEEIDVSLILQGKARGQGVSYNTQLGNYLIDNICTTRTDCIAFISPDKDLVVNNRYNELSSVLAARAVMRDSSYGVLDSGYKYQYDRYNDVFRWIPLNGDIAGLCVRTDQTNDAWWSPAGFKRGQIKNVVKLAWNPREAERNVIYPVGINPVVSFPNQGTILYGDRTMLSEDSAFNRINVRRLFIVLRKAISKASQGTLFEFNDDFTRAQFRSIVNPYLKDIQGRRGIEDFLVKCDVENNPGEVRQRNEFVGDIYIKPNYSINFIKLNFIAVRADVAFSEVIGKFG